MKPRAIRISDWGTRTEIVYECAKCGKSFAIEGTRAKYCSSCGEKIDWDVVTKLSKPFIGDENQEKELINVLNAKQLNNKASENVKADSVCQIQEWLAGISNKELRHLMTKSINAVMSGYTNDRQLKLILKKWYTDSDKDEYEQIRSIYEDVWNEAAMRFNNG